MKALLQSRPLGIPLHATATHLALGFAAAALFLDAVAWLGLGARDTTGANVGAYALVLAAIVAAALAALAGLAVTIDLPDDVRYIGWWYVGALVAVALVDVVNAFLRNGTLRDQTSTPLQVLLSVATLVVVGFAAWLGGTLVERELEEEFAGEEEEPEIVRRRRRR